MKLWRFVFEKMRSREITVTIFELALCVISFACLFTNCERNHTDLSFLDAMYSMGFCYEELERYQEAHDIWTELVQELDRRGLVIEREYPARMAEQCLKRMTE